MAEQPNVEDIDWTQRREEIETSIGIIEDSIETLEGALSLIERCCCPHPEEYKTICRDLNLMIESMHTTRVELHIEKSQLPY